MLLLFFVVVVVVVIVVFVIVVVVVVVVFVFYLPLGLILGTPLKWMSPSLKQLNRKRRLVIQTIQTRDKTIMTNRLRIRAKQETRRILRVGKTKILKKKVCVLIKC
jgi:hypothetical protein